MLVHALRFFISNWIKMWGYLTYYIPRMLKGSPRRREKLWRRDKTATGFCFGLSFGIHVCANKSLWHYSYPTVQKKKKKVQILYSVHIYTLFYFIDIIIIIIVFFIVLALCHQHGSGILSFTFSFSLLN